MPVPTRLRPQRFLGALLAVAIVLAALAPSMSLPTPFARAQDEPVPSGDVIVVLGEDSTRAEVRAEAAEEGVRPDAVYTEVIDAFAADVTQAEADALAADPDVAGVFLNSPVYAAAQTLPTGVDRIDADTYPAADIDATDDLRVDVDIAVLDSGIDATHPDLNVVAGSGVNCQDSPIGDHLVDDTGHGTHVAGIAAAIDNGIDTVGVAPGARLHSVKVLRAPDDPDGNSAGEGTINDLICGLEWVVLNAGVIDVVNMSITGAGMDGDCASTPLHTAICATVDAGVPVVVAAGNTNVDASLSIPATYAEVITVSAITDTNGVYGGGTGTCNGGDDKLASYSNRGADIDIAAPGSCIRSSRSGGGTSSKSGTSMAAPHVAGAAGLYLAANPDASPADVRAWLLTTASQPQDSLVGFTGDRDSSAEPLLWLGDPVQPTVTPSNTPSPTATATATPPPTFAYPLMGGGRSAQSASYTYIRDGNLGSSWITKPMSAGPPAGAFVYTDLGSAKPIGTVRWIFGSYGYADVFRIETSTDLVTWTTITRRNGKPPGAWYEKALDVPVTGRYVRFSFENPRGDLLLGGLAEVQVWAPGQAPPFPTATPTPTPTPVLGGGDSYLIVGSSQSSNSLDADLAHDGNELTSWRTNYGIPAPSTAEARFQISSIQVIGSVGWVFNVGGRADAFTIEISDDGAFWESVFSGTNAPSGVWQTFELPSGATAKFVRWRFTNPSGDAALGSLAEVEILPPVGGGGLVDRGSSATSVPSATPSTTAIPSATATPLPSASATPIIPPTDVPADASPATDASPVAEGDSPSPNVTVTGTLLLETASPTSSPVSAPFTPTADSETSTGAPAATAPSTVVAGATGEPTTAAVASATDGVATTTPGDVAPTATTDNPEAKTDPIPVVGVRRTGNSANGWTALDGDSATVWRTTESPPGRLAILTLDLGDPVAVAAVRLLVADDGFSGTLTVEASDDLASWTAVATLSPADLPAGEWTTLTFDAPTPTRYIRLVVVNPGDLDALGGVAEVQLIP